MPESRKRKGPAYIPPPVAHSARRQAPSPPWVGATILALFAIGVLYLIVYYVSNAALPISALGGWNIFVGFGFIVAGFGLLTQWK